MNLIIPDPMKELLRGLEKKTRKLIGAELRKFQDDKPVDLKKIKTEKDRYRIAVGDWRIMLFVQKESGQKIYHVFDVVIQKDAYR